MSMSVFIRNLNQFFRFQLVSSYGDLRNCYQVCQRWKDAVLRVAHNHKVAIVRDVPEMKLLW